MGKAKGGKPKGKMSSYAFFVQTCREEHKKKHPGEQVDFSEFSKKCSEKWKAMIAKEKKKFEEMAEKDKARYESEVANSSGGKPGKAGKRKRTKDPNAPKRNLSAFFFFCNEERPKVKAEFPGHNVSETAKELGKRWETCSNKSKFESMATKDKGRYEQEMMAYRSGSGDAKKAKTSSAGSKIENDDDDKDDDDKDEEVEDEDEDEGDESD